MRELNNPAWRRPVGRYRNFSQLNQCNIVCLQETKSADVDKSIVADVLGSRFSEDFLRATNGTRGRILVASTDDFAISFDYNASGSHFITGTITDLTK